MPSCAQRTASPSRSLRSIAETAAARSRARVMVGLRPCGAGLGGSARHVQAILRPRRAGGACAGAGLESRPEHEEGAVTDAQRAGPLAGTRVLEFSQIIAAPLAGMLLADMGADVVKVESPNGDRTRRSGSIAPGTSKRFQWLNRGKRSLVLDLERPEARALVYERLLPRFDVVMNNFRLNVARSLGIDYETIAAHRPDVIYARITGFGASGPLADDPAIDLIVQAYSGMMADEGRLDAEGTPIGTQSMWVADLIAGVGTALGVVGAVHHHARTGEGQLVDASLLRGAMAAIGSSVMREPVSDAVFSMPAFERVQALIEDGASFAEVTGAWADGSPLRQLGAVRRLYQSVYMAKDGPLVLGATSPGHREAIRGVLGTRDEGGDDPDFDPLDPRMLAEIEELRKELAALIRARTVAEWVEEFRAAGAPVAPMHFSPQLADDPQAAPLFAEIDDPITGEQEQLASLFEMSATPVRAAGPAPPLGRHGAEVLREAGLSDAEIEALQACGAVGSP
ncbi:MAG: CoA transferase [Chloroflexi bacterium]|nr:CoA transferase [Chloroflexota bacterium]